jgi:hypothetical protein
MGNQHSTSKTLNIVTFGDSLTEGYYKRGSQFHPYSVKLEELLQNDADLKKHFKQIKVRFSDLRRMLIFWKGYTKGQFRREGL